MLTFMDRYATELRLLFEPMVRWFDDQSDDYQMTCALSLTDDRVNTPFEVAARVSALAESMSITDQPCASPSLEVLIMATQNTHRRRSLGHLLTSSVFSMGLLAMVVAPSISAQGNEQSEEVRRRNECRQAMMVVERGRSRPQLEESLRVVVGCGDRGSVEALVSLWDSVDEAMLTDDLEKRLLNSSLGLRDQRIFEALLDVAASGERAIAIRYLAFETLYSYATVHGVMRPDLLERGDRCAGVGDERVCDSLPAVSGIGVFETGSQPVAETARADLIQLMEFLQTSDGDEQVRRAAGVMLAFL